jgi:hypothetical protein
MKAEEKMENESWLGEGDEVREGVRKPRSENYCMRRAWMALGAYIFTYLFFAACFELMAYKNGVV